MLAQPFSTCQQIPVRFPGGRPSARKREGEGTPELPLALNPNLSTVRFHCHLAKCETQARARLEPFSLLFRGPHNKLVEHPRQQFGGDSLSRVPDPEAHPLPVGLCSHLNAAPRGCMVECV